jgi:hypothetical protein
MSEAAKVTKISAVRDFKPVLASVCEAVVEALCAAELEARRTIDWLEHEQLNYWRRAVKHLQEKLAQAKNELNRRKLVRASGHKMDLTEQKEALDLVERQLREAEQKVEATRKWVRTLQRAVDEYLSHARQLASLVEGDPPTSVALLERILSALDAYLTLSPAGGQEIGTPASSHTEEVATELATDDAQAGATETIDAEEKIPENSHP